MTTTTTNKVSSRSSLAFELGIPYSTFNNWLNAQLEDELIKAEIGAIKRIISPGQRKKIIQYWNQEQMFNH
jgi:hypothetical protein